MTSKELLQKREIELLDRLRPFDPEAVAELEGIRRALDAFDPSLVRLGEFTGLDYLTAAEKFLRRVGKATIDEAAEAMWNGGMRPPESAYSEGKIPTEQKARNWVIWRFKQAIGRHVNSAHGTRQRIKLEKGLLVLSSRKA
jgi:hypothetical protein